MPAAEITDSVRPRIVRIRKYTVDPRLPENDCIPNYATSTHAISIASFGRPLEYIAKPYAALETVVSRI